MSVSDEEAAAAHQVIGRLQLTVNHYESRVAALEKAFEELAAEHAKSTAKRPRKKTAKKAVPRDSILAPDGEAKE